MEVVESAGSKKGSVIERIKNNTGGTGETGARDEGQANEERALITVAVWWISMLSLHSRHE
jgi:hypothetical protein